MYLLTSSEMRAVDRRTIEKYGIPSTQLMENAGRAVFEELLKIPNIQKKKILIVCGKGNNGGDGRVVGRLLKKNRNFVKVVDAENCDTEIFGRADIIVDAIFGTGLSRKIVGRPREVIEAIQKAHEQGTQVISIDIPSGLSADTGKPMGIAIQADLTVTLAAPKWGVIQVEAQKFVGQMKVADIGIPEKVYKDLSIKTHWVTAEDVKPFFKPRAADTHKGSYGHALLIGGSGKKPGAILLSGRAALRTGSGLVTVALPETAFRKFPKNFLELMYEPLPASREGVFAQGVWKDLSRVIQNKFVLAIGPGMGSGAGAQELLIQVLKKTTQPLVLDADALNILAKSSAALKLLKKRRNIILTPHPGEMARLIKKTTAFVQAHRLDVARKFAVEQGVFLVLKGYRTLIAMPTGEVFVNSTGNPGMATAGMGDVLTGIMTSLLGQGMSIEQAVVSGVYLHGRAGDRVGERLGDRGLLATDVIEEIPLTIKELLKK